MQSFTALAVLFPDCQKNRLLFLLTENQLSLVKTCLYSSETVYLADTTQTTMLYARHVSGVIDRSLMSLEKGNNQTDLFETTQCSSPLCLD